MEFLTSLVTVVPAGTSQQVEDDTRAAEAVRAAELARQGHLIRLWRSPLPSGQPRTLGLWRAADEHKLRSIVATLPLHIWMTVEVTALSAHPNDPTPETTSSSLGSTPHHGEAANP